MQSTRRDRRTGFHSGFAEPINYHCFSLSPRPCAAILGFTVYGAQKPDGSVDAGIHFKYDIKGNTEG